MSARSISVSIDVFQMIWSLRRPGKQDEDAVLRRVLPSCMAPLLRTELGVGYRFGEPG